MNTTYINNTQHPELTEAVINQCGGWDDFIESAQDVANHGADGGTFGNFIYYSDTCKFYQDNRTIILRAFQDQCIDLGETMAQALASFRCIHGLYAIPECESFLMGLNDEDSTDFENALAWWALEAVCRDYVDWEYSRDEPESEQ